MILEYLQINVKEMAQAMDVSVEKDEKLTALKSTAEWVVKVKEFSLA